MTEDWRHRAACKDEDPELFFPVGNNGSAQGQIDQAKQICRRCPVISECLAWALDTGQDDGVWGGLSEDDRRELKGIPTKRRTQRHELSCAYCGAGYTGRPTKLYCDQQCKRAAERLRDLTRAGKQRPLCAICGDPLVSRWSRIYCGRACRDVAATAVEYSAWSRAAAERAAEVQRLTAAGQSPAAIAVQLGIGRGSVYRIQRRLRRSAGVVTRSSGTRPVSAATPVTTSATDQYDDWQEAG